MNTNKFPKIFKKAIKGTVGGLMLNDRGNEEEFLLKGDPSKTDINQITVEIPNAESEKYFIKHNKSALANGYLIEITDGGEISFDATNAVSDGYLRDLLKLPYTKMKNRVDEFTSPIPVNRLLQFAMDNNKPIKTITYLRNTLQSLQGTNVVSTVIADDSVTAKSIG